MESFVYFCTRFPQTYHINIFFSSFLPVYMNSDFKSDFSCASPYLVSYSYLSYNGRKLVLPFKYFSFLKKFLHCCISSLFLQPGFRPSGCNFSSKFICNVDSFLFVLRLS